MTVDLQQAALLVTVVGLPLGLYGLWNTSRQNAKSRDLQVALNMVEAVRLRWENRWRQTLLDLEVVPIGERGYDMTEGLRNDILDLLNWIDWLGSIIRSRLLHNPDVILLSLGPPISRAIDLSSQLINESEQKYSDTKRWRGVRVVEQRLPETTAL